jgi:hypothetical protein
MVKRSRKAKGDFNANAFRIVAEATGGESMAKASAPKKLAKKNPAAVALGRLGGKKGGPARAASLTAKERSAIALKAAHARWGMKNDE